MDTPKRRGRPVTNPPRPPKKVAKIADSTRMEIVISGAGKARLKAMAQAAGLTLGEYLRRVLAKAKPIIDNLTADDVREKIYRIAEKGNYRSRTDIQVQHQTQAIVPEVPQNKEKKG